MTNVVIAGYARSPFHFAGKGELARVRADDLCAQVIRELIARTKVSEAIVNCQAPFEAGLPDSSNVLVTEMRSPGLNVQLKNHEKVE